MRKPLLPLIFALLALAGCRDRQISPEDMDMRLSVDFCKTREDVRAHIGQYIPDVSDEQIDRWTAEGLLEAMEINGEQRYFRCAASNLFLIDPACKAIRDAAVRADAAQDRALHDTEAAETSGMYSLIDSCISSGKTLCNGEDIRVRHTITLDADAVPAGETVRCWIPFPRRDTPRQKNVKLLSANCPGYRMPDIKAPHSAVYMEQKAEAGKPTVFRIEYSFTSFGEYHDMSCIQAAEYDRKSDLYRRYTREQAPHIVFSDRMRELSDSLTAGQDNPVDKAKAIFCWIDSTFPWAGAREYGTIANIPEYVLDCGHGDCGQKTLLFMTLARIAGIPCAWESGLTDVPWEEWNMHDWCRVYFEGIGWIPVDQSAGIPEFATRHPELTWFNFGASDSYKIIVNSEWGKELQPRKRHPRSEPVDFQRGELEWKGGNLYFDRWDMDLEYERLNK